MHGRPTNALAQRALREALTPRRAATRASPDTLVTAVTNVMTVMSNKMTEAVSNKPVTNFSRIATGIQV